MRLTHQQSTDISACVRRVFGPAAEVLVYGSMLDEQARGGDVDLLVLTDDAPARRQRAMATVQLEAALNRPVDLTVAQREAPASAWVRMVRARARPLETVG